MSNGTKYPQWAKAIIPLLIVFLVAIAIVALVRSFANKQEIDDNHPEDDDTDEEPEKEIQTVYQPVYYPATYYYPQSLYYRRPYYWGYPRRRWGRRRRRFGPRRTRRIRV